MRMIETLAEVSARARLAEDQAAGLRRLFAPAAPRLLPVITGGGGAEQARWLAQLGEAFARAGQSTLLVDGARAQVASALGLRARFDLLHALTGQCHPAEVALDAAPGLTVVPAARACEQAPVRAGAMAAMLAPALDRRVDVVLLLLPPARASLAAGGDALVPVLPTRESVATATAAVAEAARRRGTLAFRWLFLAMDRAAAARLEALMAESIGILSRARLAPSQVAAVPRDLAQVVAAAGGFALSRIAPAADRIRPGGNK
jgi:Mrp family chromosome partitioning ATPase